MSSLYRFIALALVSLLSACAAGSALPGSVPSGSPAFSRSPVKHRLTRMTLRITIPHASSRSRTARRAHYVSPATQSLVFAISFGGTPVTGGSGYANVTPGSTYCSGGNASQPLLCDVTLPLDIAQSGSYTIAIATFDQPQSGSSTSAPCLPPLTSGCAGNLLSQSVLAQTLTIGADNTVSVVLGGVPASLTVAPVTPGYLQGNASGLLLWGKGAQQIAIETRDADGNAIVGPGSPSIAVSSSNSTDLTVTSPSSTSPNTAILQATTSGSPAVVTPGQYSLTVTATPTSASGASPLTVKVPVNVAHSIVYVSLESPDAVDVFYDGNVTSPNVVITNGLYFPSGLAVDANGTLYVINAGSQIAVYPSGATTPSFSFSQDAQALAIGPSGTLYTANGDDTASSFLPLSTSPTAVATSGIDQPSGIAVDGTGKFFITNYGAYSITIYAPGQLSPTRTLLNGTLETPEGVTIDPAGNLYASNHVFSEVFELAAGTYDYVKTYQTGVDAPIGLAADAAGNLWVANNAGSVVEFGANAGSSPSPIATIPSSAFQVNNLFNIAVVPEALIQ